jgi:hypothetical protein
MTDNENADFTDMSKISIKDDKNLCMLTLNCRLDLLPNNIFRDCTDDRFRNGAVFKN